MGHNNCFRRKRHSYAACDAALAASISRKAQYNSCCFLFVKRRRITIQWFHVKTFEFACYCFNCLTLIFFVLFCFCKTNFDVLTIFSELSGLKGNVLFMEIYTPMKSSTFL